MVLGTLVYNEILILPFAGLNQYTKAALAERAKLQENKGLLDSDATTTADYMATSPQAPYDANRQKRAIQKKQHDDINRADDSEIHADYGYQ